MLFNRGSVLFQDFSSSVSLPSSRALVICLQWSLFQC